MGFVVGVRLHKMDAASFVHLMQTSAHFSETSVLEVRNPLDADLLKRAQQLSSCTCSLFATTNEALRQLKNTAALVDYKEQRALVGVRVAQDLLSFPARSFYAFQQKCCSKCYDAAHGISHYGRDQGNKVLKEALAGAFIPEPLCDPGGGRPAHEQAIAAVFLKTEFGKRAHTTSRDGNEKTLPCKPRVTHLYASFAAERSRLQLKSVSLPTFRRAFDDEIVHWKCPRYHLECKACKTCWLLDRQIHAAEAKGMAELAGSLRRDLEFHVTSSYCERLCYYKDRENAAAGLCNCIIADFTYSVTIPYLQQRTSVKDELEKMLVGFGCLIDHASSLHFGGTKFFFNLLCGGKDDSNTVFSMIYFQLLRVEDRLKGKILHLQLDSASSNKSVLALAVGGWFCLRFKCERVFFNYLVAGHTGEDVDGATAAPRIAIRSDGDVFSWRGALNRVEVAFRKREGDKPEVLQFLDLEKGPNWSETQFNKPFQHFLLDFSSFLLSLTNKIANFTQKMVQRPEFSVHSIQFVPKSYEDRSWQIDLSVKRLRSSNEAPWSNAVQLFKEPLSEATLCSCPNPIFWGDPTHGLSKGVNLNSVCESLLQESLGQSVEDLAFNRSFVDEVRTRTVRHESKPVEKKKKTRTKVRRTVAMSDIIVLQAGRGRGNAPESARVSVGNDGDDEEDSESLSAEQDVRNSDAEDEEEDDIDDEEDSEERKGLLELRGIYSNHLVSCIACNSVLSKIFSQRSVECES